MVVQSARGKSRAPPHDRLEPMPEMEFVPPIVEFVAFVDITEGVVRKMGPVIFLVALSERHSALDQDLSASCTGAKVALLVAIKPKIWSPSLLG